MIILNREKTFLYLDRAITACLCFLIFCLPFTKAGAESFTLLAFVLWIVKKLLGFRSGALWGMLPKTELNMALGVFIAANALLTIFSTNFGLSLRGFFGKELKFIAIYFMLVEVINSKKRLWSILIAISASAVLMTIDAGVQYFKGIDFLRGYPWQRLSASFMSANGFGGWLVVVILVLLGFLLAAKHLGKSLKSLLLILIVLLLVCLLATYARGAWLGFIIGASLMIWFIFKNFSPKMKLIYLSAGISLLAVFLILPQPIKVKIEGIGRIHFKSSDTINSRIKSAARMDDLTIQIRLKLWMEALRIIRDYNFTGCGLNTYSMVARNYKSFDQGGVYAHNSYLQMAAETGLFGLFAFLAVLFIFFKIGFRQLNIKCNTLLLGLLSGILAFLVNAFFDTHFYALQLIVLFWYMLGLTIAVIKVSPER
ncbi:MAG: O-antigen ligase family protein [Candidatus Omnitrophota bacterium]